MNAPLFSTIELEMCMLEISWKQMQLFFFSVSIDADEQFNTGSYSPIFAYGLNIDLSRFFQVAKFRISIENFTMIPRNETLRLQ